MADVISDVPTSKINTNFYQKRKKKKKYTIIFHTITNIHYCRQTRRLFRYSKFMSKFRPQTGLIIDLPKIQVLPREALATDHT